MRYRTSSASENGGGGSARLGPKRTPLERLWLLLTRAQMMEAPSGGGVRPDTLGPAQEESEATENVRLPEQHQTRLLQRKQSQPSSSTV
jgi:hypothetical protein